MSVSKLLNSVKQHKQWLHGEWNKMELVWSVPQGRRAGARRTFGSSVPSQTQWQEPMDTIKVQSPTRICVVVAVWEEEGEEPG